MARLCFLLACQQKLIVPSTMEGFKEALERENAYLKRQIQVLEQDKAVLQKVLEKGRNPQKRLFFCACCNGPCVNITK